MPKTVTLHLAKVSDDPEEQVQMIIKMGNRLSGRPATEDEIAEVRKILGAPDPAEASR